MAAFVNIPRSDSSFWEHIGRFETRAEAIAFVKEKFGADNEGRICLVSLVSDEIESEDDALELKDIPLTQSGNKGSTCAEVLQFIGIWSGEDLSECLNTVYANRGKF